jgi:hypothetical protein
VAHLYAKNTADLFYGYGYAPAQSHGNLLLPLYGGSRAAPPSISGRPTWRATDGSGPTLFRISPKNGCGNKRRSFALIWKHSQKALTTMPRGILRQFQQKSKRVLTYIGSQRLAGTGRPVTAASLLETPEAVAAGPSRLLTRRTGRHCCREIRIRGGRLADLLRDTAHGSGHQPLRCKPSWFPGASLCFQ